MSGTLLLKPTCGKLIELFLHLFYFFPLFQAEKKIATIHNVFAIIRGSEEPDRYVLLGNHRDAWTYGAVDPNSGTAVLLDIARRYALMMRQGWQPRRTIVLCSWDAEEFGMVANISSLLVINIKWTRLSISRSFCYFYEFWIL